MRKFDFAPRLRGLNLVTIEEISFKENSKGEYIDILVSKDGVKTHIFNNINENTESYVIAQLINLGDQLKLTAMPSDELLKAVQGKEAEIDITDSGFNIRPYTQLETVSDLENVMA